MLLDQILSIGWNLFQLILKKLNFSRIGEFLSCGRNLTNLKKYIFWWFFYFKINILLHKFVLALSTHKEGELTYENLMGLLNRLVYIFLNFLKFGSWQKCYFIIKWVLSELSHMTILEKQFWVYIEELQFWVYIEKWTPSFFFCFFLFVTSYSHPKL